MNNWSNIFNRDFYPTPDHVLDMMQLKLSGEVILEPSAGKGNIIDYCKLNGAKQVLFCEINKDLAQICSGKGKFLKEDFLKLTKDDIPHITQIVMNPPFTRSKEHLLHAWEIAPEGCEITTLFNSDTFHQLRYESGKYRELKTIVEEHGNEFGIGNVFNLPETERKTNVSISVIKLYKPITNESRGFEGFYMDAEPEELQSDGIMKFNDVKALVNAYVGAAKCFDEFEKINEIMKNTCAPVGMGGGFSYSVSYDKHVTTKADFLKALQRKSWKHIFSKMNMNKYLTSGVMRDVDRFVEQQTKVPFTVKNIYRMFEIIVGTKQHNFDRALVEVVDSFTKHTHENRYGVEGWKTNEGHLLGKKFIINYVFEVRESWTRNPGKLTVRYSSHRDQLDDLVKVLCNLTGFDYTNTKSLSRFVDDFDGIEANKWYENGFFEFKGFKKGTIHIKFTDDKVWEQLNRRYAKIVGMVLPTNFGKKDYEPEEFKTGQDTKTQRKSEPLSTEIKDKIRATILQQQSQQLLTELFTK
jgi:hypothetical protein